MDVLDVGRKAKTRSAFLSASPPHWKHWKSCDALRCSRLIGNSSNPGRTGLLIKWGVQALMFPIVFPSNPSPYPAPPIEAAKESVSVIIHYSSDVVLSRLGNRFTLNPRCRVVQSTRMKSTRGTGEIVHKTPGSVRDFDSIEQPEPESGLPQRYQCNRFS